jgi:hypothetical protein
MRRDDRVSETVGVESEQAAADRQLEVTRTGWPAGRASSRQLWNRQSYRAVVFSSYSYYYGSVYVLLKLGYIYISLYIYKAGETFYSKKLGYMMQIEM